MWKIILILTSGEFALSSGNPCLKGRDHPPRLTRISCILLSSLPAVMIVAAIDININIYYMYVKSWCSRCFHWDWPSIVWIHVFSSQHEKNHSLQLQNYPWPGQALILSSEGATTMNVEMCSAFLLEGIMPKQTFRSFHKFNIRH